MTTKSFLFYTCLLLTIMIITACSNEEITSKDFNHDTDIEQKMLLNELGDFTTYYINSIYRFYDPRLDYIDLDSLNLYMLQYKFSAAKTRSNPNIYVPMDYNDYFSNILSEDGYKLVLNLISQENISTKDFQQFKEQVSLMKETDREQLDFIIKATDIIYENIMSNITNKGVITRSRTSCNIATTVASFAAGAIWGAAFGGPVGLAINLAWSIAGAIAADSTC